MKKLIYSIIIVTIQHLTFSIQNSYAQTPNDNKGAGNCLNFDGISDFVDIPDIAAYNVGSNLTVEAWVNMPDATPASNKTVVSKTDDPVYSDLEFNLNVETDGRVRFWISNNGINNALIVAYSATKLSDNQWHHVVGRYDGANLSVFLDGVKGTDVARTGNVYNGVASLRIGKTVGSGGSWLFPGKIDEVRIWNTARTADEIQSNMCNALQGNETGLIGYWNMNEGTGNTVGDLTSNNNSGTRQ